MSDPTPTLVGPKILLIGDSGTGKTRALGTLVDWAAAQTPAYEVFVVFTENGRETLMGYWTDRGLPVPENLHWHEMASTALSLKDLTEAAKNVGMMTYEGLTKLQDGNRGANNPAFKFLQIFADFPCDRTGKKFGNVGQWTARRILAIDSMTETANLYEKMLTGNKPVMAQNEYGVAQNNMLNFLRFMCSQAVPFGFVMTGHVQKQVNEVTGATNLTIKAIGKAISDDIPRLFSEVIYCHRNGAEWLWSTLSPGVVTKTRYLPLSAAIKPDFAQIMDKWMKRGAA